MIEYYPFKFIKNQHEYYCIWYYSEKAGFFIDTDKLKKFNSIDELKMFARSKKMVIEESETSLSFDYAVAWLEEKEKTIDSLYFFYFWNIISDLAHSVGEKFAGSNGDGRINSLYDKLFFGNNGAGFVPCATMEKSRQFLWSKEEIADFEKIVQDGLQLVNLYF